MARFGKGLGRGRVRLERWRTALWTQSLCPSMGAPATGVGHTYRQIAKSSSMIALSRCKATRSAMIGASTARDSSRECIG